MGKKVNLFLQHNPDVGQVSRHTGVAVAQDRLVNLTRLLMTCQGLLKLALRKRRESDDDDDDDDDEGVGRNQLTFSA